MIFHAVNSRSPEWERLRLGIPTASEFHKILTPKERRLSKQPSGYMFRLLAEWVSGESLENYKSEWMDRGTELEDRAIQAYELLTDRETQPGGFITTGDGMAGCSPDRLVGDDGDLEIKAPLLQTQIEYALTGTVGDDYMCQLQGRMWIHGRKWVDVYSYHPRLSIPPLRVLRDEEFIAELAKAVGMFTELMLQKRVELEQRFGPFVRLEPERDHSNDLISEADLDAIIAAQKGTL